MRKASKLASQIKVGDEVEYRGGWIIVSAVSCRPMPGNPLQTQVLVQSEQARLDTWFFSDEKVRLR